jgi:hypothetical protein
MYAAIASPSPHRLSVRFAADSCHVAFDAPCVVFRSIDPGRRNRRRGMGRTLTSSARGSWLRRSRYRLREFLPLAAAEFGQERWWIIRGQSLVQTELSHSLSAAAVAAAIITGHSTGNSSYGRRTTGTGNSCAVIAIRTWRTGPVRNLLTLPTRCCRSRPAKAGGQSRATAYLQEPRIPRHEIGEHSAHVPTKPGVHGRAWLGRSAGLLAWTGS